MIRNLLAEVVTQAAGQGEGNFLMSFGLPILLMFGIIYFLMIRPQQKQAKKHKEMIDALKRGDQVVTNGGIYGKIFQINDDKVTLEVADGVRIRMARSFIAGTVAPEAETEKKSD